MIAKRATLPRIALIMGTFLIFIFLSLYSAPFDTDAKEQLINILMCAFISLTLLQEINSPRKLSILLHYIGNLATLSSIAGLIEFLIDKQLRVESTFANPNYYALFLGIGWCCVYSLKKDFRLIHLALISVVLILTGSRAGLLFPILQILWSLYIQRSILKTFLYSIVSVFVIVAVLASGLTRFSSTEDTEGSDSERLIFARIAFNMAADHPFNGVGWGRFVSEFSSYSSTVDKIELEHGVIDASMQERRVTHNDFLRIMAELGWVALLASILFTFISGIHLLKSKAYSLNALFPIWAGLILFSLLHNNLNTAFTWFFLLLPLHLKYYSSTRS